MVLVLRWSCLSDHNLWTWALSSVSWVCFIRLLVMTKRLDVSVTDYSNCRLHSTGWRMAVGNIRYAQLSYTDLATEGGFKRFGILLCEYVNCSMEFMERWKMLNFNVLGILVTEIDGNRSCALLSPLCTLVGEGPLKNLQPAGSLKITQQTRAAGKSVRQACSVSWWISL